MSYYEKGEHLIEEQYTKNGYRRETLDEQRWRRDPPSRPPSAQRYERVVDDLRRTDYAYRNDDGGFSVRRPSSRHSLYEPPVHSIHNGSRSELLSPGNPPAVSRPGSPGPVAGAGDIMNTEHGFTIQLDVKHFTASEIKVVLNDDLLCVNGERSENCGDGQTLRRSFSRKYSIPSDIQLDSIRSNLSDSGVLVITGSRRGWKETHISMHPASVPRRAGSVISTV